METYRYIFLPVKQIMKESSKKLNKEKLCLNITLVCCTFSICQFAKFHEEWKKGLLADTNTYSPRRTNC